MNLTEVYRAFHPTAKTDYMFFSSACGIFSKIDHILGHKTSLNTFKKSETRSSIFSCPQWYENKNQLQEENCKIQKMCRLNNMLPKNQWVKEEI